MAKKKEAIEEPLEKQLWKAADKLRKNIDAAEYKHVVLGLIFLKYISVYLKNFIKSCWAKLSKGLIPKTGKSTKQKMYSLYLPMLVGHI